MHIRNVWENAFPKHTVNYLSRETQGKLSPLRQLRCKRNWWEKQANSCAFLL